MSKKLVLGLALTAVLISGPFIEAQATVSAACWAGFCSAETTDMDQTKRDMDQSDTACRDAHPVGPTTSGPMDSPDF
jgi:hypothetical protein